jgi:hypothetical protein
VLIPALNGVQCRDTKGKFALTHVGGYGMRRVDVVSDILSDKKNDLNTIVGIASA